jgi:hypothetical protein
LGYDKKVCNLDPASIFPFLAKQLRFGCSSDPDPDVVVLSRLLHPLLLLEGEPPDLDLPLALALSLLRSGNEGSCSNRFLSPWEKFAPG